MLPNNSLSPNDTVSPHFHTLHQTKKKCGHGVIQNASFNPKTIYFRGPELVPEKSLQQHHRAIHSSEESYGLASVFYTCNKHHAFLLFLKGGSPVGPVSSSSSSSSSSTISSSSSSSSTSIKNRGLTQSLVVTISS